jgi:abortive infection bacteriophage resistance protein
LESRNLIILNKTKFKRTLQKESYYNIINGYKKHFLISTAPEKFFDGTTFEQIHLLYLFDQTLRILFFEVILKIEQNIKALIAYHFLEKYGHDHNKYLNVNNFDNTNAANIASTAQLINDIQKEINVYASRWHSSILHYLSKHKYIPLWVLYSVVNR